MCMCVCVCVSPSLMVSISSRAARSGVLKGACTHTGKLTTSLSAAYYPVSATGILYGVFCVPGEDETVGVPVRLAQGEGHLHRGCITGY